MSTFLYPSYLLFSIHLETRFQLERNYRKTHFTENFSSEITKMANPNVCANNCLFNVYLIQSHTRKQWCEVTVDSLKTLLAINTITNGSQLAGWGTFDEKLANERIKLATACAKQATRDIAECEYILKTGCQWCISLIIQRCSMV